MQDSFLPIAPNDGLTNSNDAIVFTVECSDGQETYTHEPGRYCWRYIDNLVQAGGEEMVTRRIDFSRILTCRALKLLERIFCVNHPIGRLSTTTGFSKILYMSENKCCFDLKLSILDMGAVVDCLQHCVELDMRYKDASIIAEESELLFSTRASVDARESSSVTSSRRAYLDKVATTLSERERFRGAFGPQGPSGSMYKTPVRTDTLILNGEAWAYEWSNAPSPFIYCCITSSKDPSQGCDNVLPLVIFSIIVYDDNGRNYWPVEQVLRATCSAEIVEAISDYMPTGFARTNAHGHPLFPKPQ